MKALYILLIAVFLVGCGPSAEQITATAEIAKAQTQTAAPTLTPTLKPTITPTPTLAYTLTPEFTEVYESESLGVFVRHPTDWEVSEEKEDKQITIEKGENQILIYFLQKEIQDEYNGDPISALTFYISALGVVQPDKERLHLIQLDDSEYAFGSYESTGEWVGFYHPSPQFIAMHFTAKYSILTIFNAPNNDYEEDNRKVLDMVLASLPAALPVVFTSTPTPVPDVSGELPELPHGYNWQGVKGIDFALPVPVGWFVTFTANYESYQGGLQEYDYNYIITQEDPYRVGSFSPSLGAMSVWTFRRNDVDAADRVREFKLNLETSSMFTVVDMQYYEQGDVISYKFRIEGIDSDTEQDDPDYYRSLSLAILANTKTNTFYFIYFESPTHNWEQEWETGQVMMNALLELLGGQP